MRFTPCSEQSGQAFSRGVPAAGEEFENQSDTRSAGVIDRAVVSGIVSFQGDMNVMTTSPHRPITPSIWGMSV
jgi:hypothetical protein